MSEKLSSRIHHCHATGCERTVKPEYLMCPSHWRMVPIKNQIAVLKTYRVGQCNDLNPSLAYCEAAREAVIEVATWEHKTPDTRLYDMLIAQQLSSRDHPTKELLVELDGEGE